MSIAEERSSRGSNGRFGREGGVAGSRMERCRIRGEIGFRDQKDSSSAKLRSGKDDITMEKFVGRKRWSVEGTHKRLPHFSS